MIENDVEFLHYLDFEYVEIGNIQADKQQVRVDVYGLIVLDTHPEYSKIGESQRHILVFNGVEKSQRLIAVYESGQSTKGAFKEPYFVEDESFLPTKLPVRRYRIDAVLRQPPAWVGWEIICNSYKIEIP